MYDYLLVRSEDRSSSSSSSSNFQIIIPQGLKQVKSVELIWASIPFQFYNIRSGVNDSIKITEGAADATGTLTPSSYTESELATHVASILTSISPGGQTYSGSFSSTTRKITITRTAGTNNFGIDFTISNTCYKELGFNAVNLSQATSQTGVYVPSLVPESISIQIKEFPTPFLKTSNHETATFIIPLPFGVSRGSTIEYKAEEYFKQIVEVHNNNITILHIVLLDEDGKELSFNGADWSFLLKINK